MASIISTLTNSSSGASYTPTAANIVQPTTAAQVTQGYTNSQNALTQQQNLLSALQGQNGLQNQSNVYNQLQGVVNGTGPNPAQAMLANTTGQNIAQQNALMAGQRGAGANTGLIARQAAQQGASTQQQAAGQAAALQAQQSLNALGQAGNVANTQAGQQIAGTGAVTNANQAEQQQLLGAINAQNQANVANQSNVNQVAGGQAQAVTQGQYGLLGGALQGAALGAFMPAAVAPAAAAAAANGGPVDDLPSTIAPATAPATQPATSGPRSAIAKHLLSGMDKPQTGGGIYNSAFNSGSAIGKMGVMAANKLLSPSAPAPLPSAPAPAGASPAFAPSEPKAYAKGGKVPALVSPGEQYIPPKDIPKVAAGKDPLKAGERIPGTPKYPGNDYRNDTVPKTLESGGLVIPNEIMQSKNPHKASRDFVAAHLATSKKKRNNK